MASVRKILGHFTTRSTTSTATVRDGTQAWYPQLERGVGEAMMSPRNWG
jgi:hypothetical protein